MEPDAALKMLEWHQSGIAIFGCESEQRALRIPGQRCNGFAGISAHKNFRAIFDTNHQYRAVAVTGGKNIFLRMTGNDSRFRLQGSEHHRLLAHRAVLTAERPQDHAVGAGRREEFSANAPRHRANAGWISRHAHVARVSETPAVQGSFMHGGDKESVI